MKNSKRTLRGIMSVIGMVLLLLSIGNVSVQSQSPSKVDTTGYKVGILNNMRMDAVDADHIDGDFINQFLEQYPKSRLRGHGHTIKRLADKYGLNVAAYLGQIAKETTFGSATCGGEYNFGCYMWADWMGVPKVGPSTGHNQYDRDWAAPQTVERGIEIQMELVRDSYVNKGLAYYPVYLERYSPAFENDHTSFESLMYGVFNALGQPVNEARTKTPGGLANSVKINPAYLEVTRGGQVTQEQLNNLFTHEDITRVEWLEDVSTQQVGKQEVSVYVEFKDATVTRSYVEIEVLPKEVEVTIVDIDTGEVIAKDTSKETESLKLDVTGAIDDEQGYTITTDAKDVLSKLGLLQTNQVNTQTTDEQESDLVEITGSYTPQIIKEGGQVYVELTDFKEDTFVYVSKEDKPLVKVDEWINTVRQAGV